MNIRVITASAGTGKTTQLSKLLDEAIASQRARPEGIVATTFTRQAAAELVERARTRLLDSGRGREAHQLLAARIGTVNAVCGSLVTDYAFELGASPELRVLDENAAELELKRALASVVSATDAEELEGFKSRFDRDLDWRFEVRKLVEAARANDLDAGALRRCAERSIEALDACLGAVEPDGDGLDGALRDAIEAALAGIDRSIDHPGVTEKYLAVLAQAHRDLARKRLRWGDWAKLASSAPGAKLRHVAEAIVPIAARHIAHPRLRADMHRLIALLFEVAATGLTAYQEHKRERGVIDFVDQETLALRLLRRDDVRDDLAGQIDLVLVDEFQDTSPIQLAIFLELAALARESVWVGDPKQAIYGFRGTDPKLMDAAIESLTSPTNDPELVRAAVAKVGDERAVETLSSSYRSRPGLVDLTSDMFAPAFETQGMPQERTRLQATLADEPAGLGPFVEHWPLPRTNETQRAKAVAAGIRTLLARAPGVRDVRSSQVRPAGLGDVAVLCRTNKQCQAVAEGLGELGIPAVVPRMGLLGTLEAQVALAGLRLWIDPRDALAAATLARALRYPTDLDGFVQRALDAPGFDAFGGDPAVVAVTSAAATAADLDAVSALEAVIDAIDLRSLCAAWGDSEQRTANLDALRAHAVSYVEEARAGRDVPTLTGLLAYVDAMADEWGWYQSRSDSQALLGGERAVTVSTWHRAKGLEWPITVLFGLESLRDPVAYGVHVMSDRDELDIAAPLDGRWLRFWPNPYTTSNQEGAVKDAYAASPEYDNVVDRTDREALRVLYVGWTRARDRLILAAAQEKLLGGLLGKLSAIDPGLIAEPTGPRVTWAGRSFAIEIHPSEPAAPVETERQPGSVIESRTGAAYAPARVFPSEAAPVPCTVRPPIELGARLALRGAPDMEMIGRAVHGFLAADDHALPAPRRTALAEGLLSRHGVADCLSASEVVEAADRLWRWLADSFAGATMFREWPLAHRLPAQTVVSGAPDLVVRHGDSLVLIDHKTFPGSRDDAAQRAATYSGQLATYAAALRAATGLDVVSWWIHLPVLGALLEVSPEAA